MFIAVFVTLVSVMLTAFFLDDQLSRPINPYIDSTVTRWLLPMLVLTFCWGTSLAMWFAIATGRNLFKM